MKLRIKELRTKAGLTQQELADRVFLTQSMVACIEADTKLPGLETAKRIADALKCSIDDLIVSG